MYLNVLQSNPQPTPSVRGLGQVRRRRGMGRVRVIQIPVMRGHGFGGLGQSGTCAAYLAGLLASFPAPTEVLTLLPESLGIIFINPPITTPAQAAQNVYSLASSWCTGLSFGEDFGTVLPSDCLDDGQASAAAAYPAWLAYYNSLPSGVWAAAAAAGGTPAQLISETSAVQNAAQTASSPATPAASNLALTSATLENLSSPGDSFIGGDQYQLTISGSANSTVTETGSTQNGNSTGGYSPGSTNESGSLIITGTFGQSDIGNWTETWQVGSLPSDQVSFSIAAAPAGSSAPAAGSPAAAPPAPPATPPPPASSAFALPSWLTADYAGIPLWGWGAGALVLLMIIPRGGR